MTTAEDLGAFVHTALCHDGTDELSASIVPFIERSLQTGDTVYVNLSDERAYAVKRELGRDADRVRWSDTRRWHPHPAHRLRAIQELADGLDRHGFGRLRFVGECAFPPGPSEFVTEWGRFDAVLNHALVDVPMTMVCAYDTSGLAPDVVAHAMRSHPMTGLDPSVESATYLPPAAYLSTHRASAAPPPRDAARVEGVVTPAHARALVQRVLGRATGISRNVIEDVAVAVTELVTNAWQVGARSVQVSCWRVEGEVGAQVVDDGPGLDDPLAGYRRPATGAEGGRGLWIVRQLADVLEISPGARGTAIQLRVFDRALAPASR